jgi:hypothetical protein
LRRSVFLGLLAPVAALLLLHFYLQTRKAPAAAPAAAPAGSALLAGAQAERLRASCRGRAVLDPYRLDPHPVRKVGFEVATEQETRFCQVGGGPRGPLSAVRCAPLGPSLQGTAAISGEPGDEFLLASLGGVFGLDGKQIAATTTGRASVDRVFVTASGAAVKLRDPLGGQSPGAVWRKGALVRELDTSSSSFLVAGHLLREADGSLLAWRILGDEPGFGPELRVGSAAGFLEGRLRACRHESGWEVVVPQQRASDGSGEVTFRVYSVTREGWSTPREAAASGVDGEAWSFTCAAGEGRIAWVNTRFESSFDRSELRVLRCNAPGCQLQRAAVHGLGLLAGPLRAAPWLVSLGDEAALLWSQGTLTQAIVAPLEKLAETPPQVLVNEPLDLVASEVISRENHALVLLHPRGNAPHVYPFRLGRGGASPLGCEDAP